MIALRTAAFLLFAAFAPSGHAADSHAGANCDLKEFGVNDNRGFLRLDRELRAALDKGDAAALSLLMQFPLSVNGADDSRISLRDAATLQKQFDRVFPLKLRDAIKKQPLDNLICKYGDGIGYDNGNLWVGLAGADHKQFRIVTINSPDAALAPVKKGEVSLACSTRQFRIVIDATGADGKVRYRAWNEPRSTIDKPDIELTGTHTMEGTSPCTHRIWHFENKDAVYDLSEPGCGAEPPPEEALADIIVTVGGQQRLQAWCF